MGAYDQAHWQTAVLEIKGGIGVLERGTVLASGTAGDIGKLVKLTAGTEARPMACCSIPRSILPLHSPMAP